MPARGWKNPVHRVLNLALYLLMSFLIGTGLVMWVRLPPGSARAGGFRGGRGGGELSGARELMGLNRHEWGDLHLYAALAFVAIGLAHLWLNRVWLKKVAASNRAWRIWAGLAGGVAIVLALALWPAGG
ncbi:MAG: DUF4405 domain-containing protein [Phycisphaerales bacterium]